MIMIKRKNYLRGFTVEVHTPVSDSFMTNVSYYHFSTFSEVCKFLQTYVVCPSKVLITYHA